MLKSKAKKKILHLTLMKRWFDLIAEGKKKEEYREIKPYWIKRLAGKSFDKIYFRNGYNKSSPFMCVEWKGMVEKTHEGKKVFAIKLGKILKKA